MKRLKQVAKVAFYLPLAIGGLGILIMPFLTLEPFYFVQLALMLLFVVSIRFDYGFTRFGEVIDKHRGWQKALDHLVMLTAIGLMGVLGQTALTPFFGWLWTTLGVVLTLLYLWKASGWKPQWLHERYERAGRV